MRYFSPKYKEVLFSLKNLDFGKFEGVDPKYDHRFFKFLPKKKQRKHFRSQTILVYFATRVVD